jgi:hypothetical protein
MTPDEVGVHLHDKATRGLPLSADEQSLLAAWYARQDEEEGKQLAGAGVPSRLAALREQVSATLVQIIAVSQRIQNLNQENEGLRKEIASLEQRLPQKAS